MLEELILLIVIFVLGWMASTAFHRWIFGKVIDRLGISREQLQSLADDLEEENDAPQDAAWPVKLELHNGTIYAYRKDTEEFIAQGNDKQSLLAAMLARFPTEDKFRISIIEGADLLDSVAEKPH